MTSSLFAEAAAAASAAMDDVMGETLRLVPRWVRASELVPAGPDPDRPVLVVRGVLTTHSKVVRPMGDGARTAENASLAVARARVSFDETAFLSGQQPRAGDQVFRSTARGGAGYRLLPGLPVPGRYVFPLVRLPSFAS